MEKAYFPMRYYRLTQGYGKTSTSHKYLLAIDVAGKDSGIDEVYAPFTGTIKKIYSKVGVANTVWIESNDRVLCANGEETYLTMLIAHDNNVKDLKVGQVIKQGEHFMEEGRSGNATGNHIHIELSNTKFSNTGWSKNKNGVWQINNPVKPNDYLFIKLNTVVLNDTYNGSSYALKLDNDFGYLKEVNFNKSKILFNNNLTKGEYKDTVIIIKDWCNDIISKY